MTLVPFAGIGSISVSGCSYRSDFTKLKLDCTWCFSKACLRFCVPWVWIVISNLYSIVWNVKYDFLHGVWNLGLM